MKHLVDCCFWYAKQILTMTNECQNWVASFDAKWRVAAAVFQIWGGEVNPLSRHKGRSSRRRRSHQLVIVNCHNAGWWGEHTLWQISSLLASHQGVFISFYPPAGLVQNCTSCTSSSSLVVGGGGGVFPCPVRYYSELNWTLAATLHSTHFAASCAHKYKINSLKLSPAKGSSKQHTNGFTVQTKFPIHPIRHQKTIWILSAADFDRNWLHTADFD